LEPTHGCDRFKELGTRESQLSMLLTENASLAPATERATWRAIESHYQSVRKLHLRDLFAADLRRGERFTAEAAGLYLDYSKNRITGETLDLLVRLAEESQLRPRIEAMFRGEMINTTEGRAALHVALRVPRRTSLMTGDRNVVSDVHAVLDKMARFSYLVRSG